MSRPMAGSLSGWVSDLKLADLLLTTLIALSSVYLVLGELLTRIKLDPGVSLNLVVSIVAWMTALLVCALQRSWLALSVTILIPLAVIVSGVQTGNDTRHLQYSMPLATFFALTSAFLNHRNASLARKTLLLAALCVMPIHVAVSVWAGGNSVIPRGSATVVPLVVIVLLFFSETEGRRTRYLAQVSSVVLLALLGLSTARMAFLLTFLVIFVWVIAQQDLSLWRKLATNSTLSLLSAVYWLGTPGARERIFGRDATIQVGPLAINGEGRSSAYEFALGGTSDRTWLEYLVGNGGGSSGEILTDSIHVLDKPHNEFIRAYVDGGFLLLMVALAFVLIPLCLGVFNFQRSSNLKLFLIPVLVSVTVLGFSLSDNPMSYVWFVLPAALLVSWSRSVSYSAAYDVVSRRATR